MLFSKPKRLRVNVMLDADILDALNDFAALNGSNRSHLLNEILRPSMPAIRELMALSVRMKDQADPEKTAQTIDMLNSLETRLNQPIQKIPNYIKGIQKNDD